MKIDPVGSVFCFLTIREQDYLIIFMGGKVMDNKSFQVRFCCGCGKKLKIGEKCKCKTRTFFVAEAGWKNNKKQEAKGRRQ